MRWLALVLPLAACALVGCAETPGKGPIAEAGFRSAAPVLAAIDRFREDRGHYPSSLRQLVPQYLRQIHQVPMADSLHGDLEGFQYNATRGGYSLVFVYYTFRANVCAYDSDTKKNGTAFSSISRVQIT